VASEVKESDAQRAARGSRVLVVDDDPQLARALAKALTYMGFNVTIADGGRSALGFLNDNRFDALVLDLRMPDMDGIDLLRHAAGHPNFPRTILHSAYLDVPTTVEAMRAGATEVLQKPLSAADLARRIRELIGRAPSVSGQTAVHAALRGESADTSLLLGDSSAMRELREAGERLFELGSVECYTKPLDVGSVLERLTAIMAQGTRGHIRNFSLPSLIQLLGMERNPTPCRSPARSRSSPSLRCVGTRATEPDFPARAASAGTYARRTRSLCPALLQRT
jgi:CheY-like chemotaxis protein